MEEVAQAEACVASLACYLGEPASSDPANLFAVLWTFISTFDQAYKLFCHSMASSLPS